MHALWYVVVGLVAYIAYAAFVVHKIRMASLRAVHRVSRALENEQLDLAWTMLADLKDMYET